MWLSYFKELTAGKKKQVKSENKNVTWLNSKSDVYHKLSNEEISKWWISHIVPHCKPQSRSSYSVEVIIKKETSHNKAEEHTDYLPYIPTKTGAQLYGNY